VSEDGDEIWYRWSFPYFEPRTCIDPPRAHVSSEFIAFHRPLLDYWKAFMAAGFIVVDYVCVVLEDCTAGPIRHGLPRSNHDASLMVIQTLFGWVARSEAFITALEGLPIAAAPEPR
jgi:hypothetical protein